MCGHPVAALGLTSALILNQEYCSKNETLLRAQSQADIHNTLAALSLSTTPVSHKQRERQLTDERHTGINHP